MTWNSAPIDISGHDDVSFSFKLDGQGGLDSSGAYADFFRVIAVVDGVEHELMTQNGDVCNQTFTLDDIPEGDELIIRMEVKTTTRPARPSSLTARRKSPCRSTLARGCTGAARRT